MKLGTIKKINKMNITSDIKELLYEMYNLNLHYYSDNLIEYAKEYFEILEEEYSDVKSLYECLEPRLNYEIQKYLTTKKILEKKCNKQTISRTYNVNTVLCDINKLHIYNEYNKYKSGYEYGRYVFHLWFLRLLDDLSKKG